MRTRTFLALSLLVLTVLGACSPTGSQTTQAPPAEDIPGAAQREGRLLIYSTTDSASAQPVLADFKTLYPAISVEYNDLNSTELYNRFTSEAAAGADTADFLWSSAMDLQMKLASDGYSMTYTSPEAGALPPGSVWENKAFATTLEPLAITYNKRALPADAVPQSHADLTRVLRAQPELFRDKVTTYDPEQSGTGYLAASRDSAADPNFWDLVSAAGAVGLKLNTSTGTMIERVAAGEYILGYDVIGSYVLARTKTDPNVGIVLPKDYTIAISRVALIAKDSKRPNAAKVFLDYLLSKRGQEVMAQQSLLYALRTDAQGEATPAALSQELGNALKPVQMGADLVQDLDPAKRTDFFNRWRQGLGSR